MATAAEIALLRRLVGDTAAVPTFTDAQLGEALDAAPSCPLPLDQDGFPITTATAARDTYGVAADLWLDRALTEETTGVALPEPARVTSERNGDLARTYAGAGKTVGAAELTPARMRAMAARLRKRSCLWTGGARTILVQSASGTWESPVRGGLYPSQLVN